VDEGLNRTLCITLINGSPKLVREETGVDASKRATVPLSYVQAAHHLAS
jgi:hypothetical protein